ncbi:MAG: ribosome biogenesis GTPase YlqF [Microcoleus sp. CSU_2_2]|nr:ribosome biogenesis GTPase YlqF [Microcoleus sp. SU_5_3]NJS11703.1 ribosome biogenesis GTPase YlqF [Microcoleus sp. CSU_2_2]
MKIQWYPGHIAKAERALKEQLKKVDVILEVRDARIPLATYHPQMPNWVGSKAKVLVINRMDMIPSQLRNMWEDWFEAQGETAYFTNASHGRGVDDLAVAVQNAGVKLNQRRFDRGMLPRPVRAVVMGFPNVGKSALINRLLGRRVVDSARKAGVTRSLRWIRISDQIELLDAPGVIPNRINNQENAVKLAICEDIGEAAYDNQLAAAAMVDLLTSLQATDENLVSVSGLKSRYKLDPASTNGGDYLHEVAKDRYKGDVERTARQMLNDFRTGVLGQLALEFPPAE